MGRRGPAPAPAAVQLLKGETRPSRVNFLAPLPASQVPHLPRDMDDVAKQVWRRIVRNSPAGLIRSVDADMLRAYCEAVSRYTQAAKLYAQSGPLILRDDGFVKTPLHQVVRDDADQIRLFARELGLSPSARAGLRVDPGMPMGGGSEADIGLPPRLRVVTNDA